MAITANAAAKRFIPTLLFHKQPLGEVARTGPFVRCRSGSRADSGRTLDKTGKTDNGNLNGVRVCGYAGMREWPLCSGDQMWARFGGAISTRVLRP